MVGTGSDEVVVRGGGRSSDPGRLSAVVSRRVPSLVLQTKQSLDDLLAGSATWRQKVATFIDRFDEKATAPGTQLKLPKGAVDRRIRTARVDQGIRAVLADLGNDEYALLRVMAHDAGNEYAVGARFDISSLDGLPRLIDMQLVTSSLPVESATPASGLFDHRRPKDFEQLGVPEYLVASLLAVPTHADLEQMANLLGDNDPLLGLAITRLAEKHLTVEQIDAELVELIGSDGSAGEGDLDPTAEPIAREPYDTSDLASAVRRAGNSDRFRLLEDSSELLSALQGDLPEWTLFLHPSQRAAAYSDFSGPARVTGGAGTGKTVVLLHRAKALLDAGQDAAPPRILLTTYTDHLKSDLEDLLVQLVGAERASLVTIRTVDELARKLHEQMSGEEMVVLSESDELIEWADASQQIGATWTPRFLQSEYRHVLLAQGVHSLEAYKETERVGRGSRLSVQQREQLWPAFEMYEARTRQVNRVTALQVTELVASWLAANPIDMYDHVLVDEAQDLHASQWRLLRALVPVGSNDLFLVGDAFQRIYGDTVSLRSLGIETRGRSRRLRRNYRTTHQIVGWALGLIGDEVVVDLDELGADLKGYHSVRHGPRPAFHHFETPTAEAAEVAGLVQRWISEGRAPDALAVTARTADRVDELVAALESRGLPVARLDAGPRVTDCVNVSTMQRVKGLEYECVAVTGLSRDLLPPPGAVCPQDEDLARYRADLATEKSLVYVAATRARDELLVSWAGQASELLEAQLVEKVEGNRHEERDS